MKGRFNPYLLYLVGALFAIGQVLYFYPQLPDPMASHFGPSGKADGWMSKDSFIIFYAIISLVTVGTLGGIGLWLGKIPTEMINLPNKEYWLAPERRAETIKAVHEQMTWFGAATMALLIAMMQLTFQANLTPQPQLDDRAWWLLGGYLFYTGIWTVGLLRRFGRKA